MTKMFPKIRYDRGTILLEHPPEKLPPHFRYDERSRNYRSLALYYSEIKEWFETSLHPLEDTLPSFPKLSLSLSFDYLLFPYQKEALEIFFTHSCRGLVVLPTGAGKTYLALKAIEMLSTPTLVIVPTLDLMFQWYSLLTTGFQREIGLLGGGYHEINSLTVSTYDSAYIWAEEIGDKYRFLVFDEVHHLPSPKNAHIAEMSIAPYRLGLTATLEREDGRHELLKELVGPVVYRKSIKELAGQYLSEYEVIRLRVPLTKEEEKNYAREQRVYLAYLRSQGLKLWGKRWKDFVKLSSYDREARKAMLAYQNARHIVFNAQGKIRLLDTLLKRHLQDKVLIFTESNELVYWISKNFLIPAITHETEIKERKKILSRFCADKYRRVITSRVLEEGIDVPEANVAIILSGTSSSRQHLQRLGRILRQKPGKHAYLYELITLATKESQVSYRRRKSDAYR